MTQWVLPLVGTLAFFIRMPVRLLGLLLNPVHAPKKAAKYGLSTKVPATHEGDPEFLGS